MKFGALFFGLVYGLGFLIIAIHHAQFSIPEFDPLKPKIFSTGVVFILLVGLPVLGALRMFGIFGLERAGGIGMPVNTENRAAFKATMVFSFWYVAYGIAWLTGGVFVGGFEAMKDWGFTCLLLCGAAWIALLLLMRFYFNRLPTAFILAVLLVATTDAFVTFKFMDRRLFWICVWAYIVGLWGLYYLHLLNDPEERRKFEWERLLPVVATAVFIYGAFLYRYVTPYFGGGRSTPSALYFASKVPFTKSDSSDVQFLEETNSGYYVLIQGDEKHAYFVRRDLVSAIHFGVPEKSK